MVEVSCTDNLGVVSRMESMGTFENQALHVNVNGMEYEDPLDRCWESFEGKLKYFSMGNKM